ncbi:hypothetical protein QTO34_015047 [Cnephaeus nilssonii]|uniref:Uncharacterized protein n=1 Tax=Cnephaeus nilssonii TaxID=3371016 RepID=A0AA40I429_CNENI|nr:hypothetical protein QTO34_015047 [Eptesicus nilssonii]
MAAFQESKAGGCTPEAQPAELHSHVLTISSVPATHKAAPVPGVSSLLACVESRLGISWPGSIVRLDLTNWRPTRDLRTWEAEGEDLLQIKSALDKMALQEARKAGEDLGIHAFPVMERGHGFIRTQGHVASRGPRGCVASPGPRCARLPPDPGPSLTRIQGDMASPGPGIQLHLDPGAHGLSQTQGRVASPGSRGTWPHPDPGSSFTRTQGRVASPGPRGAPRGAWPHPDPGAHGLTQTRDLASPGPRGAWPHLDPGARSLSQTQGRVASPGPRCVRPHPDPGPSLTRIQGHTASPGPGIQLHLFKDLNESFKGLRENFKDLSEDFKDLSENTKDMKKDQTMGTKEDAANFQTEKASHIQQIRNQNGLVHQQKPWQQQAAFRKDIANTDLRSYLN